MKTYRLILLFSLIVLSSCTQKYFGHHVIDKQTYDIRDKDNHSPITKKMIAGRRDEEYLCSGQWLFLNNAQTDIDNAFPTLLSHTCEGDQFIGDVDIKHTWWTTLIYTRACYDIKATCPRSSKSQRRMRARKEI